MAFKFGFDLATLSLLAGALAPVGALWIAVYVERQRRRAVKWEAPQKEKLLRPPGYSLRQQIEILEDRLLNFLLLSMGLCGITAAFMPVLMQSLVSAIPAKYKILSVAMSAAVAIPAIVTSVVVARTVVARTNLRLGLSGEQATAEALNELSDAGFRAFHDLKPADDWNIDHVVAGSKGVFVIETKTRSRRGPGNGLEAHKVRVEGSVLTFPFERDEKATAQAERNARWLSDFLSKRTGEVVAVEPIVVLPGWYVIDPEKGPVSAMGCNYLKGYLRRQDEKIPATQVARITAALDDRNRTLDFV